MNSPILRNLSQEETDGSEPPVPGDSDEEVCGDGSGPESGEEFLSQTTLELPGNGSEPEAELEKGEVEEVDMRDSQRDSWWGNAYKYIHETERFDKIVVPIELLFDWMVAGRPSENEYLNTFTKYDLKYLESTQTSIHKNFHPFSFQKNQSSSYTRKVAHARNFNLRHVLFSSYLDYCLDQYQLYGHGDATAKLCSPEDWRWWCSANSQDSPKILFFLYVVKW